MVNCGAVLVVVVVVVAAAVIQLIGDGGRAACALAACGAQHEAASLHLATALRCAACRRTAVCARGTGSSLGSIYRVEPTGGVYTLAFAREYVRECVYKCNRMFVCVCAPHLAPIARRVLHYARLFHPRASHRRESESHERVTASTR